MASSSTVGQAAAPRSGVRNRTWIYLFLGILILAGFAYFRFVHVQSSFINHDFYRVLYEASNRFNENLDSLQRMHKSGESEVAIRSLLPSYRKVDRSLNKNPEVLNDEFHYQINGQEILVFTAKKKATMNIDDILPSTVQGFSQYLFADKAGKVVATTGGEKTISIVQMDDINLQLKKQNQRFNINFSKENASGTEVKSELPSYSSHVDMQLSYGDFRIFFFPFALETPLYTDTTTKIQQLYLVGLLPKQQLRSKGAGQWNISLLVVCLVSLIFMWALIRLVLLPENHSITRFYRGLSQFASYGFYIVLVAMILSYLTKSGLQAHKTIAAQSHASKIAKELEADLREVFNDLSAYRGFYVDLIKGLNSLSPLPCPKEKISKKVNCPESTASNTSAVKDICHDSAIDTSSQSVLLNTDQCSSTRGNAEQQNDAPPVPYWSTDETVKVINNSLAVLSKDLERTHMGCLESLCPDPLAPCTFCPKRIMPHVVTTTTWQASITNDYGLGQISPYADPYFQKEVGFQASRDELGVMSFFAGNLKVKFNYEKDEYSSYVPRDGDDVTFNAPKILTIFAANEQGSSGLPSIFYQESNAKPQGFDVSHRNYFKRVRDYRGWKVDFCKNQDENCKNESFKNIYIQRLLNLNDGARGTTISVPMHKPRLDMSEDMSVAGYILGADVVLPSVSLAGSTTFDLTTMIVDRDTGSVLFHSDESRSLVENLFFAGNNSSSISQWIKAGLDNYDGSGANELEGFYHGQAGKFTLKPSIIDTWAIVVFSPNDSLDDFMTNQFMYIVISFILILALCFGIANVPTYWRPASELKRSMALPKQLDNKRILLICTAIFTTNYGVYYISQLLGINSKNDIVSWLIPLITVFMLLFCIHYFYVRHFTKFIDEASDKAEFKRGAWRFVIGFGLTAWLHFGYLQLTAEMPLNTLNFNYEQQRCSAINKERRELTDMALKRYPNSVTQQRISPSTLMQISGKLRDDLDTSSPSFCQKILSVVEPSDYPKLNTVSSASLGWGWFNTYLLGNDGDIYNERPEDLYPETEYGLIFLSILVLFSLVWLWFYFNRKVLWPRIYCPAGFLGHIEHLCASVAHMAHGQPEENLQIKVDTTQLSGVGLALLLRHQQAPDKKQEVSELMPGFDELYQLSPILQLFSLEKTYLPNLKLDLQREDESGLLMVNIWDIETCLEKTEFRQCLLDLIMEIKSLTISKKLHSFTIYSGFRSLRRVKMKDPLSSTNQSVLEHAEYMSWSECLMDFSVSVTDDLQKLVDSRLLANEIKCIPELKYMSKYIKDMPPERRKRDWSLNDSDLSESGWATINFILLHADALYRFKWESCSSSEKVALYNLAKQHRLNPSNTDMIEHLAINGMIKVKRDYLVIINQSFAQFVLHAESKETISELVSKGEAGAWKSYRLPLAMLIVVIIGGIALTSGESIFIIMASVAGVLGTLGSLTSSASMLRGQFKE